MLLRLAPLLSLLLGACVIDLPDRALSGDGIASDSARDGSTREGSTGDGVSADKGRDGGGPPGENTPPPPDTQPVGDVTIDVAPKKCTSNADCLTLPSACHLAGSCDLQSGVCNYPTKDCSSLDGPCAKGACEASSGNCVAQPINEAQACGAMKTCNTPGSCGGFSDTCDTTGTRSV